MERREWESQNNINMNRSTEFEPLNISSKLSPCFSGTDSPIITLHGRPLCGEKKTQMKEVEEENDDYNDNDNEIILKTPLKNQKRDYFNFTNQCKLDIAPRRLSLTQSYQPSSPRTKASTRSSPRIMKTFKSPKSSPRISRLPIRRIMQPKIKALNLPLPEGEELHSMPLPGTKVTPEKLMEELRGEIEAVRNSRYSKSSDANLDVLRNNNTRPDYSDIEFDDEISLSMPFSNIKLQYQNQTFNSEFDNNNFRGKDPNTSVNNVNENLSSKGNDKDSNIAQPIRLSLRNRTSITVEAPDIPVEDPLEIARQTIQNTKINGGYKGCQFVFTSERRDTTRPTSPEPAFSKKTGLMKHFLTSSTTSDSDPEDFTSTRIKGKQRSVTALKDLKLKFNRVLKFFDDQLENENEAASEASYRKFNFNLQIRPEKPCLRKGRYNFDDAGFVNGINLENGKEKRIVEVKRIFYKDDSNEDTVEEDGQRRRRQLPANSLRRSTLTGAKRTKKENIS